MDTKHLSASTETKALPVHLTSWAHGFLPCVAGAALLMCGVALAAKPPAVEPGRIFFNLNGQVMAANSDGSNQRVLFAAEEDAPDVSALPHNNGYWFLDVRDVSGEPSYPGPFGRSEIFAVNEGGAQVRLTSDPALEPINGGGYARARWLVGDTQVAFLAQRWDLSTMTVVPDSAGIYVTEIDFSSGLPVVITPPEHLAWTSSMFGPNYSSTLYGYDFSPDGGTIYFADGITLYSAETATGTHSVALATDFNYPRLCAAMGTLIGFRQFSSIKTVRSDGSELTPMIPPSTKGWGAFPIWSPSGKYISYSAITIINEWQRQRQVIIATAAGQRISTLGAKISGTALPLGWRPLP
jgi:hypothetical protein